MSRLLLSTWSIARAPSRHQLAHQASYSLRKAHIPPSRSGATSTMHSIRLAALSDRRMSTSTLHSGETRKDSGTLADRYKLVFFVPNENAETCKEAIFATGAGSFPGGKYTKCCFQTIGTGQFLPNDGANPTIGAVGVVEKCEEARIEVMCLGREVMLSAVDALVNAHPYEEVAYEVYRMENV
ncbi:unnamed protein product [Penicillium manginii]